MGRHVILPSHFAIFVSNLDPRLPLLIRRIHDDEPRQARDLVHLLVHGDAFDDIPEANLPSSFGHDREGVGVPLDQDLTRLDLLPVLDTKVCAVDHGVTLPVSPLDVLDNQRSRAVHDHQGAIVGLHDLQRLEADGARVLSFQRRLRGHSGRRPADVKRAHRQLRPWLAN